MPEHENDASGLLSAPIDLVRELVGYYVAAGHELSAMREIVSFAVSMLAECTLIAELTGRPYVRIGDCTLTCAQARARVAALRALPLF